MGELTLKQWMGLKEISIEKLAEESGVSASTIMNIRQGKTQPNIATLKKIAEVLEIRIGDISL